MNIKEVQISEIKNLNLIYIFTTDHLLRGKTEKFIGAKIVFDENRTLSLDYTDPLFEEFIRKIIERYNKEKDKRQIILLGTLTEKIMNNPEFDHIGSVKEKNTTGFTLFNTKNHEMLKYEIYLKEVLKDILKMSFGYEVVNIDSIDGYNNKFVISYSVGSVSFTCSIIVSFRDNEHLDFRIGHVENRNLNITGAIENKITSILCTWNSNVNNLSGIIKYDCFNDEVLHSIKDGSLSLYHNDKKDTIIDADHEIIKFYLELIGIPSGETTIKVNENNYVLFSEEVIKEEETDLFIKQTGTQIAINDDMVLIRHKIENSLSKYNNRLNVSLDKIIHDITLSKLIINKNNYILVEHRTTNSFGSVYEYKVFKVDELDFKRIFKTNEVIEIEPTIKSIDEVKKLLKKNEGGVK